MKPDAAPRDSLPLRLFIFAGTALTYPIGVAIGCGVLFVMHVREREEQKRQDRAMYR